MNKEQKIYQLTDLLKVVIIKTEPDRIIHTTPFSDSEIETIKEELFKLLELK